MNKEELEIKVVEGKSTRQIAEETGYSQTNVRYWLDKYGIRTSSPRGEKRESFSCKHCGVEKSKTKNSTNQFCSSDCSAEFRVNESYSKWILEGTSHSNPTIKSYLLRTEPACCSVCSVAEWNGLPLTLEVEHIDGNSENCEKSNVCLICPNCHSQTDTYKGKNMGNGRFKRRQRYQEGKSY